MIGARELLADRVQVGVEKTFYIALTDHNNAEITDLDLYTLTAVFLKPDGSTEVPVTPTLVANTSGANAYPSRLVSVTLAAADNTSPAAADVGKPWLLNVYAAAPAGNAQPIDRAFLFHAREEWE